MTPKGDTTLFLVNLYVPFLHASVLMTSATTHTSSDSEIREIRPILAVTVRYDP